MGARAEAEPPQLLLVSKAGGMPSDNDAPAKGESSEAFSSELRAIVGWKVEMPALLTDAGWSTELSDISCCARGWLTPTAVSCCNAVSCTWPNAGRGRGMSWTDCAAVPLKVTDAGMLSDLPAEAGNSLHEAAFLVLNPRA